MQHANMINAALNIHTLIVADIRLISVFVYWAASTIDLAFSASISVSLDGITR